MECTVRDTQASEVLKYRVVVACSSGLGSSCEVLPAHFVSKHGYWEASCSAATELQLWRVLKTGVKSDYPYHPSFFGDFVGFLLCGSGLFCGLDWPCGGNGALTSIKP